MKHFLFLTTVLFASIAVAQPKEPITGFWHDMPLVGLDTGNTINSLKTELSFTGTTRWIALIL